MRTLNLLVFDQTVSGTSTTWYSSAELNDVLGEHDQVGIQASVGDVSGTSPSMSIQLEHSADGRHWLAAAGVPDIATDLAPNTVYYAAEAGLTPILLGLLRLSVSLAGTQPECRLKLFVTCRDY